MKLDRNTNRGGHGKYALVNMRKLLPVLDVDEARVPATPITKADIIKAAFDCLVEEGIITLGNETPGDQFFVMKYKDKFTACGLHGYAHAVAGEATSKQDHELKEFAEQIFTEANHAAKLGTHIPD